MSRMSFKKILQTLSDAGVSMARVMFSGGGDSGGVDSVTFYTRDDKYADVEDPRCGHLNDHAPNPYYYATLPNPALKPLGRALLDMDVCVEDRYGGFNNDPYVHGQVEFDADAGTVELEADETTTSYYGGDDEDDEGTDETEHVSELLYPDNTREDDEDDGEDG